MSSEYRPTLREQAEFWGVMSALIGVGIFVQFRDKWRDIRRRLREWWRKWRCRWDWDLLT